MKIKNEVNKLLEKYKRLFKQYPITTIIIILITFILTIFMNDLNEDFISKILEFLVIFVVGTLFTECYFDKKNRMFSYIIFIILSIIFVILINSNNALLENVIERLLYTYYLSFIFLIVYRLYKNSKKDLAYYSLSTCFDVLKTTIIYGILSFGLLLISEVFVNLILDGSDYDFILRIEFLILGLFYFPNLLEDITEVNKEINNFMKVLVHYTLLSLIILAFGIIYIYLFKIIITWSFPSNQIFRILAVLFIFYLPIWIMNNYYKDDLLTKINNKLPILFIPFIILQIYSLGIRIISNGITNMRYVGIMIIIIEIVYIILYFVKKKYDFLFYLLPIIFIITFIFPYFNMYDASSRSQIRIMDSILINEYLTDKDKSNLYSSYSYLNSDYVGRRYLSKYSKDLLKQISNYYQYGNIYNYHYLKAINNLDMIDIQGYNTLYNIYYSENNVGMKNIVINTNGINIDITNIISEYLENSDNIDEYFNNHNTFIIEDNKLIINSLIIEYDDNIKYINIEGILLK